jgi:prophage regulatory protein
VERDEIKLMGAGEIAVRLGVVRQRVYQLVTRKGFPDPIATLTMGQVWLAQDVEAWIREHRPHLDDPDEA